jgi:hypothetical protein
VVIALIIPFLVFYVFNYRTSLSLPKPSLLWKIGKVTRVTFLQKRLPYQAVEVAKPLPELGGHTRERKRRKVVLANNPDQPSRCWDKVFKKDS